MSRSIHRSSRLPKYRRYKPKNLAVVRIDGKDRYLGKYDSEESKCEYDRVIAEWLTCTTGLSSDPSEDRSPIDPTIDELILAYWRHCETYYAAPEGGRGGELDNIRDALRPLRRLYGDKRASSFGPMGLRSVREDMVRSGLARTTINARVNKIRRAFRWAASVEMISGSIPQALGTVESLAIGRTAAPEPLPVRPVPEEHVTAVLPFLSAAVAAIVQLQLWTACRVEEALSIRGCELAPDGDVWIYRPAQHKNAWRGRNRTIVLGPRAIAVIQPFLQDEPDFYLFSPQRSTAAFHEGRRIGRQSKVTPSELRSRAPEPGKCRNRKYDRRTYRQAIVRACDAAGVARWSPLQLRHTAATRIRAVHGLEAAEAVLGHSKPDTTVRYAERDLLKARTVAAASG
jgi:integrase